MSMKTKDWVKKSRRREVKKSKVEREGKLDPQPGACLLTPRLSKLKEQTGNVYENKGLGQKVEEARSQEVESRTRGQTRSAAWGVSVNSSTLKTEGTNRECL
jgi:hypothetical protein